MTTKPKVIFAAQFFYPLIGGAEHSTNILLQELGRSGWDVRAICIGAPREFQFENVTVHVVRKINDISKIIYQEKPDLLWTQLDLAFIIVNLAKLLEIPAFLFVRSYEQICPAPLEMLRCDRVCQRCQYWLKHSEIMRHHKHSIENADLVICSSQYLAKMIREFYGRDSIVIYPAIENTPHQQGMKDKKKFIIMCTAKEIKGMSTFVAIAKLIPEEKFLIVGRGNPKKFGAHCLANMTSWPNSKPEKIWSASKLLLVPSLWPEPFGRVVIEAMSYGIPVIASHVGGLPEAVKNAGILVQDYADPRAWEKEIHSVLRNEKLYHSLVRKGIYRSSRFRLKRIFPKFMKAISSLLKDSTCAA